MARRTCAVRSISPKWGKERRKMEMIGTGREAVSRRSQSKKDGTVAY